MEELICFRYSLNDKHLHFHDKQILISDNQVSYHVIFSTLREPSVPIFDSRVFATLSPGINHANYCHSSQTLGCALPGFEVFAVFPKGLCYSFPHDIAIIKMWLNKAKWNEMPNLLKGFSRGYLFYCDVIYSKRGNFRKL